LDLGQSLEMYGYPFVFGVMFLESLGVPMPSELTLVTAGVLSSRGQISPVLVILTAGAGSTTGAIVSYVVGQRGGRRLILRWGAKVGLTRDRMRRVEGFFTRGAFWAVLVGRVLSGVRSLISYPAGFFEMPFGRFFAATVIGALLWPIMTVEIGRVIGRHWAAIIEAISGVGPWVGAAALLGIAVFALRRHLKGRRHPPAS